MSTEIEAEKEIYSKHGNKETKGGALSTVHVVAEFVLCLLYCLFGIYSNLIYAYLDMLTMRDIPYFVINENDDGRRQVLLDMQLNNKLVGREDVTYNDFRLLACSLLLPLFVMTGNIVVSQRGNRWVELRTALNGFFVSVGTCEFVTQSLKVYVGRLRPNFYELCGFNLETLKCEGDIWDVRDAHKSFPSGHSSLSFCGLFFLSLWMLYRLRSITYTELNGCNFRCINRTAFLMSLTPLMLALHVAASRSVDNWHHPSDIIAGSLIGIASALVGWFSNTASINGPQFYLPVSVSYGSFPNTSMGDV